MHYTKRLRKILQSRYLFKILVFVFIFFSIFLDKFYPFKSLYTTESTELIGVVTKYKVDGNLLTLYMKSPEKIIVNYYFNNYSEKVMIEKSIKVGDTYYINGKFNVPNKNTVFNLFNYRSYLKHQKIYFVVTANNIKKTKNNTSVFYFIKNKILERINGIDNLGYLKTFILGEDVDIDVNHQEKYKLNGV